MEFITRNPSWLATLAMYALSWAVTSKLTKNWCRRWWLSEFPRMGSEFCLVAGGLVLASTFVERSNINQTQHPAAWASYSILGIVVVYLISRACCHKVVDRNPIRGQIPFNRYWLLICGSQVFGLAAMFFTWFLL